MIDTSDLSEQCLLIRIPCKELGGSQGQQHLLEVLQCDDPSALPFSLPLLSEWPQGPRAIARRAELLLRAGLHYLVSQHQKASDHSASAQARQEPGEQATQATSPAIPAAQVKPPMPASPPPTRAAPRPVARRTDFDVSLFQ